MPDTIFLLKADALPGGDIIKPHKEVGKEVRDGKIDSGNDQDEKPKKDHQGYQEVKDEEWGKFLKAIEKELDLCFISPQNIPVRQGNNLPAKAPQDQSAYGV